MPWTPDHQDIGVTLAKYEKEKQASKPDASSKAYSSIIDELSCRGWFERFPDSLPREAQTFFYVLFADTEINNGGFAQYFLNGYGKYAQETVTAYREIGTPKKAALLAAVMASFPGGKYPKTADEYSDLFNETEAALDLLDSDDFGIKYFQTGENIKELMIAYVKKHFAQFAP